MMILAVKIRVWMIELCDAPKAVGIHAVTTIEYLHHVRIGQRQFY